MTKTIVNFAILCISTGIWPHILYEHFFEHIKDRDLQCVISFKRAKVNYSGYPYAMFLGKCKICLAKFTGTIENKPEGNSRVRIYCTLSGDFKSSHPSGSKRPLSGIAKSAVIEKMIERNMSARLIRALEASETMKFGDQEPPNLPKSSCMRAAASKERKARRIDDDPIWAIYAMKGARPHDDFIRNISLDKFYVHYWSDTQIHVYRDYFRRHKKTAKLSIDATGGVVKRIERPWGEQSGNIFLYEATVHDATTNEIYPATQMLSESHNSTNIEYWLALWLRNVSNCPPKEVVSDMSLALLVAIVKVFANCSSLVDYLTKMAKIVFGETRGCTVASMLPSCFVRCDIAHVIKLIVSFPSFRKHNRPFRHFYTRAMAQAALTKNIEDLEKIFHAIFTICLSVTNGKSVLTQDATLCTERREWLQIVISQGIDKTGEVNTDRAVGDNEDDNDEEMGPSLRPNTTESPPMRPDAEDLSDAANPFKRWITRILDVCKEEVAQEEQVGEDINPAHEPSLVDDIIKLSRLIPCWTGIMIKHFGFGRDVPTSAPVESSFNDLKNRLFRGKLPLRIDDYLKTHMKCIDGGMKLVAGNKDPQLSINGKKDSIIIVFRSLGTTEKIVPAHWYLFHIFR